MRGSSWPQEQSSAKDRQKLGDEGPLPAPPTGQLKACVTQPPRAPSGTEPRVPLGILCSSSTLSLASLTPTAASRGHLPNKLLALESCLRLHFWEEPDENTFLVCEGLQPGRSFSRHLRHPITVSEGVTEAPEEKLLSRELQLSPPLPQVLGRQPLSPSGPASSQEQGLAGEARVQGERRAEGTHTGLFLGYGSLWAPTADQGAPRRRACGENHRVGVATAGPEGPGFLPGLPRPPPYFETTPKPSAWPPPSPWVTLAERAPHPQLGSTSPLRSSSAFHPCQGATPSPCPSAGLEPALGPVCRLWGTTVAELHDVPLLCHSFP